MKINRCSVGTAVSLAAASAFAIANPAEAANLAPGTTLNINGSVNISNQSGFEFFDFTEGSQTADRPEPAGKYGEFIIGAGSTGSFEGLEGEIGKILSFNRQTDLSANPFHKINVGGTLYQVFVTKTPTVEFTDNTAIVQVSGVLSSNGDEIPANGVFTSQLTPGSTGQTTYSASLKTVPEPTTMAGSAMALGLGAFFKRKRARK